MRAVAHGVGLTWYASVLMSVAALAGCLSKDPTHCANRAGNATCAELGKGAFCSICAHVDAGCVAVEPDDDCHRPGPPVETTAGTGATETSAESSSGPPPACDAVGLDPSCPEGNPYCIEGTCAPCRDGGADFCASIDPASPACGDEYGVCLGCLDDADCQGSFCGPSLDCGGCTRHDHCPESACDLERGECITMLNRLWVDTTDCEPPGPPDADPGAGTEQTPFCWIGTALNEIAEGEAGVIYLAGGDDPIAQEVRVTTDKTVAILASPPVTLGSVDEPLFVGGDGRVYTSGVNFADVAAAAVTCALGGRVWIEDAVFSTVETAVTSDACARALLRRSVLAGLVGDGFVLQNDSELRLDSSAIVVGAAAATDAAAIRSVASRVDIRYSTLIASTDPTVRLFSCDETTGSVRNSVAAGPLLDSISCAGVTFARNGLDTEGLGDDNMVLEEFDARWFADLDASDVHLDATAPFADIARWDFGDPRRDLDDTPRTAYPNRREHAGADQP